MVVVATMTRPFRGMYNTYLHRENTTVRLLWRRLGYCTQEALVRRTGLGGSTHASDNDGCVGENTPFDGARQRQHLGINTADKITTTASR